MPIVIQYIAEVFPTALDWLESQAPQGEGFVGGRFGIADVAIAAVQGALAAEVQALEQLGLRR